jgi:hypothetical protein
MCRSSPAADVIGLWFYKSEEHAIISRLVQSLVLKLSNPSQSPAAAAGGAAVSVQQRPPVAPKEQASNEQAKAELKGLLGIGSDARPNNSDPLRGGGGEGGGGGRGGSSDDVAAAQLRGMLGILPPPAPTAPPAAAGGVGVGGMVGSRSGGTRPAVEDVAAQATSDLMNLLNIGGAASRAVAPVRAAAAGGGGVEGATMTQQQQQLQPEAPMPSPPSPGLPPLLLFLPLSCLTSHPRSRRA